MHLSGGIGQFVVLTEIMWALDKCNYYKHPIIGIRIKVQRVLYYIYLDFYFFLNLNSFLLINLVLKFLDLKTIFLLHHFKSLYQFFMV